MTEKGIGKDKIMEACIPRIYIYTSIVCICTFIYIYIHTYIHTYIPVVHIHTKKLNSSKKL